MRQLEEATETPISSKHPRIGRSSEGSASDADRESLRLDDITSFCDYVVPLNAKRQHRRLRESVADRHLEMFFDTIHVFLPIFDKGNFREVYNTHRSLFGDHRLSLPSPEYPGRQQFLCLLYAILALGALYEDEREDSSAWASWYFAEAQDSLSRLLDAPNLDLVRAAMLMVRTTTHALGPLTTNPSFPLV